jgi:hypothetical protein
LGLLGVVGLPFEPAVPLGVFGHALAGWVSPIPVANNNAKNTMAEAIKNAFFIKYIMNGIIFKSFVIPCVNSSGG